MLKAELCIWLSFWINQSDIDHIFISLFWFPYKVSLDVFGCCSISGGTSVARKLEHFKLLKEFISKEDIHARPYKSKPWAWLQPAFWPSLPSFLVVCWLSHNRSYAFPWLVLYHDNLSIWNVFSSSCLHTPSMIKGNFQSLSENNRDDFHVFIHSTYFLKCD